MGVLSERLSSPPLVRLPEILLRRATQHSFTLRNPTNQKRNCLFVVTAPEVASVYVSIHYLLQILSD
jgi:hypothetical protein